MGAHRRRARLSPGARRARAFLAPVLALLLAGCSPVYLLRAGWAEARILAGRRPIVEVAADSATAPDTRGKLALALEARRFAADSLGLRVGDSYTTFTKLERDTLALVLSAAEPDRLEPRTWWFPVVGDIPYRAFFDEDDARAEKKALEARGLDTYLRPTAAFSTLGWFSDPLLSTVLEGDHVRVVETVLHELAHTHLYLPGHTRFNESFASYVGAAGAVRFFCHRKGGGLDTVWCRRARDRWFDDRLFSRYLDRVVASLREVYGDASMPREQKLRRREQLFADALERFDRELEPALRSHTFAVFRRTPLNNATLLTRMRYYHRLDDFQLHLAARGGDLAASIRVLAREAPATDDPFGLLPGSPGAAAVAPGLSRGVSPALR